MSFIVSSNGMLWNTKEIIQFCRILTAGVRHDARVFVNILKACSDPVHGRLIEHVVVETGFYSHLVVGNCLLHMYVQCGFLDAACHVFERFDNKTVITWSSMIRGCINYSFNDKALQLYQHMQYQCRAVNEITFICLLRACSKVSDVKIIHVRILSNEMESHSYIMNSLIDVYAKCGSFNSALQVFQKSSSRDVITWSAMIGGCTKHGKFIEALTFFEQMQKEGIEPNEFTYIAVIKACSMLVDVDTGRLVHCLLIENDSQIHGGIVNAFIDMYGKSGGLEDAFYIFYQSPKRDVVTWSALMIVCSHNGQDEEAIQLFNKMRMSKVDPDGISFTCALKACSNITALEQGRLVHIDLIKSNTLTKHSTNDIIDLYVKCGCLEDACKVFDCLQEPPLATWNAVILGCSESCKFDLAKKYFLSMLQKGIKPSSLTFSSLLCMCSHLGLVEECLNFFKLMCHDYNMTPELEHLVSLVHLLGRSGHLEEATSFLRTMPLGPGAVGWRSLLSQCNLHGNPFVGQQCFEHVAQGDQREAAGYVLMSSIYLQEQSAGRTEELRKYVNAWKKPAKAVIEICGELHRFNVGEQHHPQIDSVYAKLRMLGIRMFDEGYMHRW